MNNVAMAQAVQKAVKSKFYGNRTLRSKVITHFPAHLSDEYEGIARQYMALLNKTLKEHLPTIRRAIDDERRGQRFDDDFSVTSMIQKVMMRAEIDFERRARHFGLEDKIETLANTMRRQSVREWSRTVHRTLGINIFEDYYMGEFYRHDLQQWTANNVGLIKSLPGETMTKMTNIIQNGYLQGKSNTEMGRLIQEAYGTERKHALFIARDQTSKLSGELAQQQQRDAGIEEYVWSTSGDSRVRECHRYLNGKTFSWNNPPEMWYMTKSRGRVYTGRHCHPREDYQCGCVALPVFNLPTLDLPWEGGT